MRASDNDTGPTARQAEMKGEIQETMHGAADKKVNMPNATGTRKPGSTEKHLTVQITQLCNTAPANLKRNEDNSRATTKQEKLREMQRDTPD